VCFVVLFIVIVVIVLIGNLFIRISLMLLLSISNGFTVILFGILIFSIFVLIFIRKSKMG